MNLSFEKIHVNRAESGEHFSVENGLLTLNIKKLKNELLKDHHLKSLEVNIVHPGDCCRVINVLDVIEPTWKPGMLGLFPNLLGEKNGVGLGTTVKLSGVCIITCCNLQFEVQEAIVDYSPSLQGFSLFSSLCGIIMEFTPAAGYPKPDIIKSLQLAGLKAATLIAEWTHFSANLDSKQIFKINRVTNSLPGVVGIIELAGGGRLTGDLLYGQAVEEGICTIHPNELVDGAIVSGIIGASANRNTTYFYQNNPLAGALMEAHDHMVSFNGLVLFTEKSSCQMRSSEDECLVLVQMLQMLNASGVIICGGRNKMAVQRICALEDKCNALGIKVVMMPANGELFAEMGRQQQVKEVDNLISIGNGEEEIILPAVKRVYGGKHIAGNNAMTEVRVPIQTIVGSINPCGGGVIRANG